MVLDMKIVTILGARPQFIKAAAVSREIRKRDGIEEVILHTGQHYDANMSEIFFSEMNIPDPDYYLDINGLSPGAMTGQMMEKIEPILRQQRPDMVLVYGDTNSTLAGALCARKLDIPIAHVEGGLRNFDLSIPEDVNRILTDRISSVIFYSTPTAYENLMKEGYGHFPTTLVKTGDLMADTVGYYRQIAAERSRIVSEMDLKEKEFLLLTVHRKSNICPEKMDEIVAALNEISGEHPVVFPVHPNTRNFIEKQGLKLSESIRMIDPVGYFDMLQLLEHSAFVITDSGGLQREAYLMGKNSLLLMEYTPWEELIDNGFSAVTGLKRKSIVENFETMYKANPDYNMNLYGDGNAAGQIVDGMIRYIKGDR